ncbi:NepR family anti-sigma factor [Salinarimonas rosea]|uniref:NepR family anti-sigma factor n=1 Tax=Salinarimonas rosea TaxID=552063 RepID=UPI0005BD0751|nr:NepR family anti-sigma factor [Salinarimonas rosea]
MKVNKGTGVHELGSREVRGREPGSASADPRLDRAIQSRIGDQLRAMYSELMDQPVPDRFKDLLAQLENQNKTENSR